MSSSKVVPADGLAVEELSHASSSNDDSDGGGDDNDSSNNGSSTSPPALAQAHACCSAVCGALGACGRGFRHCCWDSVRWLHLGVTALAALFFVATMPLTIWWRFHVLKEWERAVVLRMGRSRFGRRAIGQGVFFALPFVDHVVRWTCARSRVRGLLTHSLLLYLLPLAPLLVATHQVRLDTRPFTFEVREKVGLRGGGADTVHVALAVSARVADPERALLDARPDAREELAALAAASARRRVEQFGGVATLLSGHKGLCDGVREDLAAVAGERWGIEVQDVYLKFAKLVEPKGKSFKSLKRSKKR